MSPQYDILSFAGVSFLYKNCNVRACTNIKVHSVPPCCGSRAVTFKEKMENSVMQRRHKRNRQYYFRKIVLYKR